MRVLVVGGAGYIGAHMSKMLNEAGHEVVVLDNLSTGHRQAIRWGVFEKAALADGARVEAIFAKYRFDAIMHFAAVSNVAESVHEPLKYYRNNVGDVVSLLDAMRRHQVRRFIFSSTAAVYGEPRQDLIDELHPLQPINPYGAGKLVVERMLAECAAAYNFHSIALRYFNAAGADPSAQIGESHWPESHLIPRVLRLAAGGTLNFRIYGDDYPTPDGTCIRDYVHVNDLCSAHLLALGYIAGDGPGVFDAFNLGNGRGYSVREVIAAVEAVTGKPVKVEMAARRQGDPARLVADGGKAKAVLGWSPSNSTITNIIETAWRWHRAPLY
jgi:UDP-glucose 4-epimerase